MIKDINIERCKFDYVSYVKFFSHPSLASLEGGVVLITVGSTVCVALETRHKFAMVQLAGDRAIVRHNRNSSDGLRGHRCGSWGTTTTTTTTWRARADPVPKAKPWAIVDPSPTN